MADRPQNFLEVLAKAGGEGLGFIGQNWMAGKQQEKANTLAQFQAMMQAQEAERQQTMFDMRMIEQRKLLLKANQDIIKATADAAKAKQEAKFATDPTARADYENTYTLGRLEGLDPIMDRIPAGYGTDLDLGNIQLKQPAPFNIEDFKMKARAAKDAFDETGFVASGFSLPSGSGSKSLSASDQIVYQYLLAQGAQQYPDDPEKQQAYANERFYKDKTQSKTYTREAVYERTFADEGDRLMNQGKKGDELRAVQRSAAMKASGYYKEKGKSVFDLYRTARQKLASGAIDQKLFEGVMTDLMEWFGPEWFAAAESEYNKDNPVYGP